MTLLWLSALLLGTVLGMVFATAWMWALNRFAPSDFWPQIRQLSAVILREDLLPELLCAYKSLAKAVLRYNLANLIGITLGLLPLLLVISIAGAPALARWESRADQPLIHPSGTNTPMPASAMATSRLVLCTSVIACTAYELLMFDTRPHDGEKNILIRPDTHDRNPLWPYLSDLEFGFYVSFMLGNVGFLIVRRLRPRKPTN
ncbi:MAG: hypothetical protein KDI42_06370 [Gammaproteobacteria bacterium]|nr:hypothetical protein [Gammaproteobacteria bacterium]